MENLAPDAIAGFILPPILAVVIQSQWDEKFKRNVAWFACLVVTLGLALYRKQFAINLGDVPQMVASFSTIVTTSMATYKTFYHATGIAPAIEKATSITKGADPRDAEIARLRALVERENRGTGNSVPTGENHPK